MFRHRFSARFLLALITLLTTLSILPATVSYAQDATAAAADVEQYNVYTVNFECGFQPEAFGLTNHGQRNYEPLVKIANYAFKLDIYNPNQIPSLMVGQVVLTGLENPNGTTSPATIARWPLPGVSGFLPGATPPALGVKLPAISGTVIDCHSILAAFPTITPTGKSPFVSGTVSIATKEQLVVWVTKTTQVCSHLRYTPYEHDRLTLEDCLPTTDGAKVTEQLFQFYDVDISHNMDTERVEPIVVQGKLPGV